jgi:hypothetical protein
MESLDEPERRLHVFEHVSQVLQLCVVHLDLLVVHMQEAGDHVDLGVHKLDDKSQPA